MRHTETPVSHEPVRIRYSIKPSAIKDLNTPSKGTLDVFGRLLYAIAMADGQVQQSEIKVLETVVDNDEWAKEIELSFNEAPFIEMSPQTMFMKNMRIFFAKPVEDHYPYFLNLMEKIAGAHDGVIQAEQKMIDQFKDMYNHLSTLRAYRE